MIYLAGCILVDEKERIGLLHRSKPGFMQWELPGGKIESNETKEEAATRELQEELGVKVSNLKQVGSCKFTDKQNDFDYTWFTATILKAKPSVKEPTTFDSFMYFSLDELEDLALSANMQKLLPLLKNKQISLGSS
jgi:8-oxo-dGTP pyrophosphatase MutT (NUDIX family)